ncbi:unnamed protein product [Rhodiola kirilowii]
MDLCRLELGRVRDELRKGRQAATNLLGLIRQQKHFLSTSICLNIPASSDLAVKIVDSFSNSLSMLLAGCQDPEGTGSRKSSSLNRSSGRGWCPKPRKGDLWTQVTSSVTADGYAWKKYGQKCIINAKHPRNYYKCIAKPQCQALKRVQKMNDDLYKITHTSHHHTCETSSSFGDKEEESAIQQPADSSRNAPPLLGIMEPRNAEWSLDDLDYLLGYVEFNDHQAF